MENQHSIVKTITTKQKSKSKNTTPLIVKIPKKLTFSLPRFQVVPERK